jgi:hypothetical protein
MTKFSQENLTALARGAHLWFLRGFGDVKSHTEKSMDDRVCDVSYVEEIKPSVDNYLVSDCQFQDGRHGREETA